MPRSRRIPSLDSVGLSILNEELAALWGKINALEARTPITVPAVRVSTTETEVRHTLGRVPKLVAPVPQVAAQVFQTRPATEKSVYLAADIACNVDVGLL